MSGWSTFDRLTYCGRTTTILTPGDIARQSDDVFRVEQGSLYPALERLLNKGWVTVEWAQTPTKRQARYYTITRAGRSQLKERVADYDRVAIAIARVMGKA